MKLLNDPVIPLSGMYPEKKENTNSKRCLHPNIQDNSSYNNQDIEEIQTPISRGIVIYLSHKRKGILPFAATWMDLDNIQLVKCQRKKNTTVYISYVEFEK